MLCSEETKNPVLLSQVRRENDKIYNSLLRGLYKYLKKDKCIIRKGTKKAPDLLILTPLMY